jgi:hypothetical protein
MSGDRPTAPGIRELGEHQGMPGDWLVTFTEQLMDRRQQLIRGGQAPQAARDQTVAEAVQAFHEGARQRGWTVAEGRITLLADDILGVEDEYRDQHGYEPELARLYALGEVLEAEQLRGEIPEPWWQDDPPQQRDPDRQQRHPAARTRPDDRADRVRTREAGDER